jgi:hypothetical protein
MKNIETREIIEKKERRNKRIISIAIGVIMLLSTAGYAIVSMEKTDTSGNVKTTYNGLNFLKENEVWKTNINGKEFSFNYLPQDTANLSIKINWQDYRGKPLYFTDSGEAEAKIATNLQGIAERFQQVCLKEKRADKCEGNLPEKNCSSNIIVIKENETREIYQQGNCTFIISNDTLRDSDAFLYKILGIK